MAEASPACRLVSLMPFASDCFQPAPVNSHDPGASRQARLWFYGADSPDQPQTTMSNSNWVRTQLMETYTIFVSNQRGALNPRPKGRGTSRALGRLERARVDPFERGFSEPEVLGAPRGDVQPAACNPIRNG